MRISITRIKGRNNLARAAHLRTGAGAMGGNKKQLLRRRRRLDRQEEQRARLERQEVN